jgi:hypothetical protein
MSYLPVVFSWIGREETIMYTVSNLFERAKHHLCESFLITYFVQKFVGWYEDFLAATESGFEDGTWEWELRKMPEGGGGGYLPYVSASLQRLAVASSGSISFEFPNIGRPGAPGIGSAMM